MCQIKLKYAIIKISAYEEIAALECAKDHPMWVFTDKISRPWTTLAYTYYIIQTNQSEDVLL